MELNEQIRNHWITLAATLAIIVAGVTFAVIEKTRIDPLQDQLKDYLSSSGTGQEAITEPTSSVPSAGALIVQCRNGTPVMLGVLHEERERLVFSPPAGRAREGESVQVTAIRETLEETGFTVSAIRYLGKAEAGNPNFSLVHCAIDYSNEPLPVVHEAVGLTWAKPHDIPDQSWRFPEQKEWVIELFDDIARRESCGG